MSTSNTNETKTKESNPANPTTAAAIPSTSVVSGRQQGESNTDYRIVVFGSAGVGKSSLVLRYVRGTFKDSYIPTIEDTYRHVITSNKVVFTLQITDTTGSHQFPAMQRLNIQKGHAFMLVYSITNRQSLEELKPIFRDIIDIKSASSDKQYLMIPMILIGSKCDETANRTVPTAIGEKLAQDYNCAFMETSSKTNTNIKEAFDELLKLDSRSGLQNGVDKSENTSSSSSITKNSTNPQKKTDKKKCSLM